MDPNATLQYIEDALRAKDYRSAAVGRMELAAWLRNGGFQPDWKRFPRADSYCNGRSEREATS